MSIDNSVRISLTFMGADPAVDLAILLVSLLSQFMNRPHFSDCLEKGPVIYRKGKPFTVYHGMCFVNISLLDPSAFAGLQEKGETESVVALCTKDEFKVASSDVYLLKVV